MGGIKFVHVVVITGLILLAAVFLFPIFAHAKLGGGPSPGYSEMKRQVLAVIMYSSDYNDELPVGTAWNTGKDQLCYPAPVGCFSTWAWSVSPYIKSIKAFEDPNLKGIEPEQRPQWATYFCDFGYNYVHLSPYIISRTPSGERIEVHPVKQTSAWSPAQTVMITSKWSSRLHAEKYTWANSFPGGMVADAAAEPPVCSDLPQLCLTNWGLGGFFDQADLSKGMFVDVTEGRYTGGVAFRAASQAIVGFLDGHSSKLPRQRLAAGTNWTPTILAKDMRVTKPTAYLWSVTKS